MNLQSYGVVICLLIDALLVTSLTIREGNRWVWRTARSTNSSTTKGPLNPFASFSSDEDNSPGLSSATQFFSGSSSTSSSPFPRDSIDSSELLFLNRRGETPDLEVFDRPNPITNISSITTSRVSSSSGFAPSPPDTTFSQISEFLRSPTNDDQRATQQLNLGVAHFTIPSQLGRPVSVTTPTSNHLTQDSEPLISSYSSLDAKSPPLEGFSSGGRSLLNRRGQHPQGNINDLEPLDIKPLPIDISTLPLESKERAEGIKKLWSTLTSRNEFAKLFNSIAGFNRSSIAQANIPFAVPFITAKTAEESETVRAQSSGEASVVEVVIPPEIQPQAQEHRQPQQLQDQRQIQPQRQQQQLPSQQQQQQVESQQEILRQRHQQLLERLRNRDESAGPQQRPVAVVLSTTQRPITTTTSPQNSPEVRRDPRQQIPQAIGFFSLGGTPGSQEPGENSQGHIPRRGSQESPSPPPRSSVTPVAKFQLNAASQGTGSSPTVPSNASISLSGQEASVVQSPTRVMSFVVRKLRLPGNHIANVVFVPAKGLSDPENSREEILHSQSVLRFFQKPSVQKSIRELNNKDAILVVEEIHQGSEKTYIISTVDGKRVYPREHTAQSREDVSGSDGNVWETFLNVFGENENVPRARPSEISGARESISPQVPFSSPSRAPLTSADFAVSVENPRAPLTRASLTQASQTRTDSVRPSSNTRIPRNQKVPESEESPKAKFSPQDVFNPDSFNPFVPFTTEDERTVKRSFPPLSQGEDVIDLSPSEFFPTLQFSPSLFEASFDRGERKLSEQHNQASKSVLNRRSSGSGFSFSQEPFMEPRAAPNSARWPWPKQVPLSLDDFFINSGQDDFKRR